MSGWHKVENDAGKFDGKAPKKTKAESDKHDEPVQETAAGDTYDKAPAAAEDTGSSVEYESFDAADAENPAEKKTIAEMETAQPPVWDAVQPYSNETVLSSRRYTAGGRRRGRFRFASLLGLFVLVLAAVGLVSLVVAGIKAIEKSQDTTALRTELGDFLNPVFQYTPSAFTSVNDSKQDALLLSAIYRVTEAERIRQLRANTSICAYELDDQGRMLIPVKTIEASYKVLFGPDAEIYNHTIGEEGLSFTFEYDSAKGYYHIPSVSSSSMYMAVIDTLKKKGDTVVLRVGFVSGNKIGYDNKGNVITPSADKADYFQLYTVKRTSSGDAWMLVSVTDDGGTAASKTTASTTAKDTTTGSATAATTAKTTAATTKAAATTAKK